MFLKKIIFNNSGLKIAALSLAVLVWALISGRERTYLEKNMEIEVENLNVSRMMDVRNRPETIRVKIRGTSEEISKYSVDDFKLRIDMKDIIESSRFSIFTEDYLEYPKEVKIESIHPKMIEISAREFYYKDVQVRILYTGRLPKGVILVERKIVPEKVRVFGYKSKIISLNMVYGAEKINLSKIYSNQTLKIPLDKSNEILRFDDNDSVSVTITVRNSNEKSRNK